MFEDMDKPLDLAALLSEDDAEEASPARLERIQNARGVGSTESRPDSELESTEDAEFAALERELEEEEQAKEAKRLEEQAKQTQQAAEAKRQQQAPQKLEQLPPEKEIPVTPQQAQQYYENQALFYYLKQNGIEVKDDGSDLRLKMSEVWKNDPVGARELEKAAENYGRARTDEYISEVINPYNQRQIHRNVVAFVDRFKDDFPDFEEKSEIMSKLSVRMFEKYPELKHDPQRAIPLLYAKATQYQMRQLQKAAQPGAREARNVPMERGTARQTKGPEESKKSGSMLDRFPTRLDNNPMLSQLFGS